MTWGILHRLESATGDAEAAARAWQHAFESYLVYRREGGYGSSPAAQLFAAAAEAIAVGDTSELEHYLTQSLGEEAQPHVRLLFQKVLAVLRGARDPEQATDPELNYDVAVELLLLLEELGEG
jgi:hypothetical protein